MRPVSLLDGIYAYEWAGFLRRVGGVPLERHASHRATTSSRTPGKVNRGTVYAVPVGERSLHLCPCGQTQHLCKAGCGKHICEAPGHKAHVCGSDW